LPSTQPDAWAPIEILGGVVGVGNELAEEVAPLVNLLEERERSLSVSSFSFSPLVAAAAAAALFFFFFLGRSSSSSSSTAS
jgi:hypothetical protein